MTPAERQARLAAGLPRVADSLPPAESAADQQPRMALPPEPPRPRVPRPLQTIVQKAKPPRGRAIASPPRVKLPPPPVKPLERWTIPPEQLTARPDEPQVLNFNGSMVNFGGRWLLAYRHGWSRAMIRLAEVDLLERRVVADVPVELVRDKQSRSGREDPRLFLWRGELWLQTTAYAGWDKQLETSIRWSQIDTAGHVLRDVYPKYLSRRAAEKNWAPFEHDGRLLCVYEMAPRWLVLAVEDDFSCSEIVVDDALPRELGAWRGGAPPIRVGDEWWVVTHNVIADPGAAHGRPTRYVAGLATFGDDFRPLRYLDGPLYESQLEQRWNPGHAEVVFPAGAWLAGESLVVSGGHQDRYQEILRFDLHELHAELRPIGNGGRWRSSAAKRIAIPPNDSAAESVTDAYLNDDYHLPDRLNADDVVIDVGANVGQVALRLHEAGSRRIIAVEPSPLAATYLRKNLHAWGADGAEVIQAAIGRVVGTAQLRTPPSGTAHSTATYHDPNVEPLAVSQSTLRIVIGDERLIRLLVIDCEGCEHDLTPADIERVDEIMGECHAVGGHDMASLRCVLHDAGFVVTDSKPGDTWIFHATRPAPELPRKPASRESTGEGDRLSALLHRIGFDPVETRHTMSDPEATSGCRCEIRRKQLNLWSVTEIVARREEVIGWLREASDRVSIWKKIASAPVWLEAGLPITVDPPTAIFEKLWART